MIPGSLEGEALVSKQPFNTTASYFENMFAGNKETAPCTDANNEELYKKDLKGAIICTPQTVGSTMGAGAIMGMNLLGVGTFYQRVALGVLLIASGLALAGYSFMLRKRPQVHPLSFIAATFCIGTVILFPLYLWECLNVRRMPLEWLSFAVVGYVAVFPSIVS